MARTTWYRKQPKMWKCVYCTLEFPNKDSQFRKFCSRSCYSTYQRLHDAKGRFKPKEAHWNYSKDRSRLVDRKKTRINYPMMRAIAKIMKYQCNSCQLQFPILPIYRIRNMMSFDHILPIKLGGTHTLENCQLLCRACNKKKTYDDIIKILHK